MVEVLMLPLEWMLEFILSVADFVSGMRRSFRRCLYTPEQLEAERLRNRKAVIDDMHSEMARLQRIVREAEIRQATMPRSADELRLRLEAAGSADVVSLDLVRGLTGQIRRLERRWDPRTIEEAHALIRREFHECLEAELKGWAPTSQVNLREARRMLSELNQQIAQFERLTA
jgi:hypothetical protein